MKLIFLRKFVENGYKICKKAYKNSILDKVSLIYCNSRLKKFSPKRRKIFKMGGMSKNFYSGGDGKVGG